MIETIILCGFNLLSFVIGAKIGLSIANKKEITLNPAKAIKDHIEEKKEKRETDLKERQYNTMLKNIDNYDGTAFGQEDIPR